MSVTGEDAIQPSSDSFWEVGKYKRTVKRAEEGFRLSEDLIAMVQERIAIEKKYAKSLKSWSQKWTQHIEKGPDYGTTEAACKATLEEADKICDVHERVSQRLHDNVVSEVKTWQKENYHKPALQMVFKEIKEFEDGFKKAQKPWVKLLTKVQKSKERYHKSCKNEKTASIAENNAKADTSKAPDEIKKSEERTELCRKEVESSKEGYQKSLEELNKYNSKYMDDMHLVFDRCNEFEQKRLDFVKEMLFKTHECLNIAYDDTLPTIFSAFRSSIENADSSKDLKWWSSTYGAAMAMNWPIFEEYTPGEEMENPTSTDVIKQRYATMRTFSVSAVMGIGTLMPPLLGDTGMRWWGIGSRRGHRPLPEPMPKRAEYQSELANITKKSVKSAAILSGNDDGVMLTGIMHQKGDSAYPSSQRASANNTPLHKSGVTSGSVRNSVDCGAEHSVGNPFGEEESEGSGGANPFDDEEDDDNWDVSRDNGDIHSALVDTGEAGVPVRALYDYEGQEDDELTFRAGDTFVKLEDEDEQGWCKGRMDGRVGLYPANYVELV